MRCQKKLSKYKPRNLKTLTYKLVAFRHEKMKKLFSKRSVLKRDMLKDRARLNESVDACGAGTNL